MTQLSDAQIAQAATMQPIDAIAARLGLSAEALEHYGRYKAKINPAAVAALPSKQGRLVLVTAINPTPAGEGKTTVTIGLADALQRLGQQAVVAVREPSLGPVFGIKGGAAGGGYAQVLPMEDINLHFTGDFHAIGAANNLLAAMLDNHIHQGNALDIDPKRVLWRRVLDMNDRQLRQLISGLGGSADGVMRADGFDITVASEVMAVFCLAQDLADLKQRLGRMLVAYRRNGEPVYAHELKAHGAMAALLKDAIRPNLVQTLGGTPALVHGGPFANIAHGCNSVIATRMAQQLGDYAITEAGFGADLGAEKFCNIKCRLSPAPGCGGGGGHGAGAEIQRRRGTRRFGRRESGRPAPRTAQSFETHRQYAAGVRPTGGGGDQPLCRRYRGRTRAGAGSLCRTRRLRGAH